MKKELYYLKWNWLYCMNNFASHYKCQSFRFYNWNGNFSRAEDIFTHLMFSKVSWNNNILRRISELSARIFIQHQLKGRDRHSPQFYQDQVVQHQYQVSSVVCCDHHQESQTFINSYFRRIFQISSATINFNNKQFNSQPSMR